MASASSSTEIISAACRQPLKVLLSGPWSYGLSL